VAQAGTDVTESDLRAFLSSRLAYYKIPDTIRFVADLPLTGAGKIDKPALLASAGR
jgi:fatty-acyl-CoA synthase